MWRADGPAGARFGNDGVQPVTKVALDTIAPVIRRHVPGAPVNDILVTFAGADLGAPTYPLRDELGGVIALTDATGAAGAPILYDDDGVPLSGTPARFGYTGQLRLQDDLYDYHARNYVPSLARFLQPDPIGYAAGLNLYAYVGGDPANLVDPLGLTTTVGGVTANGCLNPGAEILRACGGPGREAFMDQLQRLLELLTPTNTLSFAGTGGSVVRRGIPMNVPPPGHMYPLRTQVCGRTLSAAEERDLISRFGLPNRWWMGHRNPGGLQPVTTTEGVPIGWVQSTYSADRRAVRNVTTPIHVVVGTVDRGFSNTGGRTFIDTFGQGVAPGLVGRIRDSYNQTLGPDRFQVLDNAAREYAEDHYEGC